MLKQITGACLLLSFCFTACNNAATTSASANIDSAAINRMFANYTEDRMKLYPLEATAKGDNRYNDILQNDISVAFINQAKSFYSRYLDSVKAFNRETLSDNDRISYDIFKREMEMQLESFQFHDELTPLNQFTALHLTIGTLGSGDGNQPFKTVKDYDNFLSRINGFAVWADTAVANMRRGMNEGFVLPKSLTVKVIPQVKSFVTTDAAKNLFYGPINKLPAAFSAADKARLTAAYTKAIDSQVVPAFKKLTDFIEKEYLANSRSSSGIDSIPNGKAKYNFLIRQWTTTNKTPDEIYETGLKEVERIKTEMEKIKTEVGFKGDLKAFFHYILTDLKFNIYNTPEEVLADFRAIQAKQEPYLKKLFNHFPSTKFEIRRTEAFREASASAEYNQASADGSRPGIFYTPIPNAKKFNYTGMETLFAHEAIPGHHYQLSLQQENNLLPGFRRFSWYGAYGEGWALYTESLGSELGLYTDPFQKMGNLGDEMHRAIRLVVDVALHTKGWSREKAIEYMMANEQIDEAGATAEIERYMAIPAQALSYKTGALKIRELRAKYENLLGAKFNIAAFHDEILKDGCMPLDVLERKMEAWTTTQK
ncbi:MAG: DUF885 domain-containing protein [Chitinophagaceae bacterium]|nr:DUF885 domain-containing protein [Chitinophagaceae bacterium]